MRLLLQAKRRIVQVVSLVALNLNLWAVSALGTYCLPVMNCEGCLIAFLGCPIGMMGRSLAFFEFPLLLVGTFLFIGVMAGRIFCGWVCPMGFLQDLLHKIPSPKFRLPRWTAGLKYVFLAVTVMAVPLYYGYTASKGVAEDEWPVDVDWEEEAAAPEVPAGPGDTPVAAPEEAEEGICDFAAPEGDHEEGGYTASPLFFCNFCPTASLQVVIPAMVDARGPYGQPWIFRMSILAVLLIVAAMNHRIFCKVMCPVGAMIALTNRFSLHKIRVKDSACIKCRKCNSKCPMDVKVMETRTGTKPVNRDTECIDCLTCESVCPTGAISNNSRILKEQPKKSQKATGKEKSA